jgi:hypothetical protein
MEQVILKTKWDIVLEVVKIIGLIVSVTLPAVVGVVVVKRKRKKG